MTGSRHETLEVHSVRRRCHGEDRGSRHPDRRSSGDSISRSEGLYNDPWWAYCHPGDYCGGVLQLPQPCLAAFNPPMARYRRHTTTECALTASRRIKIHASVRAETVQSEPYQALRATDARSRPTSFLRDRFEKEILAPKG